MKLKTYVFTAKRIFLIAVFLNALYLNAQDYILKNATGTEGYSLGQQGNQSLQVKFASSRFSIEDKVINGEAMKTLSYPGMFLPNEAGYPDLPGNGRFIAVPQGAKAVLKNVTYDTQIIKNINLAPAPVIPIATYDGPLVYEKNEKVYSTNALYPESPVMLHEPVQIRGIDAVMLALTPFQYNPVTKELIVYNNIQVEIGFEGGNGHFGDDAYRSRWWDPILEDAILNYNQVNPINYINQPKEGFKTEAAPNECEYAIIIPNAPEFAQWADSIKKFRTEQGILTRVFTLNEIGSITPSGIKAWVTNAYNTWSIKPAAILLLGDYGQNANSTIDAYLYPGVSGYPDFASDNYYADVTGDNLPDITFSRIVANNTTQLQVLCSKFLNYERNPPTDPAFYANPMVASAWQDDRWFQVCASTVSGFFKSIGKTPTRVCALGSPSNNTGNNTPNTGTWSTASNTTTVVNYFGPSGLNYIPDKPGTLGGFSGGNATGVNNAINAGAFLVVHRDHGSYSSWGGPSYSMTSMNSLTNINNKLPFVFSINCQTGAFQHSTECFAEKFHRYTKNGVNSGALGIIGDAEVSLSFYNDCMVWGIFDNLWPGFMPAYGTNPASASRDKRPAFGNTSARYFLAQSSWVGAGANKTLTYRLYHMYGDAFQWFYSVVPQNLTVIHNSFVPVGATTFNVTADAGSFIALTMSTPSGPIILGTAVGTGSSLAIPLSQSPTTNMLVTVTKQDYLRYSKNLSITTSAAGNELEKNSTLSCYPNPFNESTLITYILGEPGNVSLSVYDMLGKEVEVILNNSQQSSGIHKVEFRSNNVSKGIYSCVLRTDAGVVTRNLVIE